MTNSNFAASTGACVRILGKETSNSIRDGVVSEAVERKGSRESKLAWMKRELLKRLRLSAIQYMDQFGVHTNTEIAEQLGCSEGTVRYLRKTIVG